MAETKYNLLTRLLKDLRNQVSSSGDIGGKSNGGTLVVREVVDGDVLLDSPISEVDGYRFYVGERAIGPMIDGLYYCIDFNLDVESLDDLWFLHNGIKIDSGKISLKTEGDSGVATIYIYQREHDDPPIEEVEYALTHLSKTGEEMRIKVISDPIVRLDKTYKEIDDAGFAVLRADIDVLSLSGISYEEGDYWVEFGHDNVHEYSAVSADDYPKREIENGPGGGTK